MKLQNFHKIYFLNFLDWSMKDMRLEILLLSLEGNDKMLHEAGFWWEFEFEQLQAQEVCRLKINYIIFSKNCSNFFVWQEKCGQTSPHTSFGYA